MKDKIILDVFDENNNSLGEKAFYAENQKEKTLNQWLKNFLSSNRENELCAICTVGLDFQHNNFCNIAFWNAIKGIGNAKGISKFSINPNNLIPTFVYFSVRHTIPATWINDRDQFLFPNENWEKDKEFQNNCFVYALFHGQNKISNKEGTNHFIPFAEKELNVKEAFESHFLLDFMAGKIKLEENGDDFFEKNAFIPQEAMEFSNEAQNVLNAAKALYIYYHQMAGDVGTAWKINDKIEYLPNAALYDIKEFFQGRNEKGRMNAKSEDLKYTELLNDLKNTQKILAQKIEPKIYEYGFLLE